MGSMITANYDSETDQIIDASPRLNNGVANSSVPMTASISDQGIEFDQDVAAAIVALVPPSESGGVKGYVSPGDITTGTATEKLQGAIDLAGSAGKVLIGQGQQTGLSPILAKPGSVIDRLNVVDNGSNAAQFFGFSDSADEVVVYGSHIESGDGSAIYEQATSAKNCFMLASFVHGASYGWLSNEPSGGTNASSGMFGIGNYYYSNRADAIEWNHPKESATDYGVFASIANTGNGSTFAGSGFGIGVAGTHGWQVVGLAIQHTRSQAVHVEDGQQFGLITSVYCRATEDHGFNILAPKTADGPAHGVCVTNASMKFSGADKTGFHGVNLVYDAYGSLGENLFSNIKLDGFDYGFNFGGKSKRQIVKSGHAINCNIAVSASDKVKVYGDVLSTNCPTLARGSNLTRLPHVISTTEPTAIFAYTGNASNAGATMKGFAAPFAFTHTGSGTEIINIPAFAMPYMMDCRITAVLQAATNYFRVTANVVWNGTTLTLTNANVRHNGSLSGATFVNNAGTLAVSVYSSTAISSTLYVEVEGDLYYR